MHLLDLTLTKPEENLALDEALLITGSDEFLRFWASPTTIVVLGRSSQTEQEVDVDACKRLNVPILRRVSGGAAIVAGVGCLMYAVVLDLDRRPELRSVDRAHAFVLGRIAEALREFQPTIVPAGVSDLAYGSRANASLYKFSGNSVRLVRSRLLYHGTLLYDFDLELIDRLLRTPPRQPSYRVDRSHRDFVDNIPSDAGTLCNALATAWDAKPTSLSSELKAEVDRLVHEKYLLPTWNFAR